MSLVLSIVIGLLVAATVISAAARMNRGPRLAVLPIGRDLRTRAQVQIRAAKDQALADQQLEDEWRRRVRENERRRAAARVHMQVGATTATGVAA